MCIALIILLLENMNLFTFYFLWEVLRFLKSIKLKANVSYIGFRILLKHIHDWKLCAEICSSLQGQEIFQIFYRHINFRNFLL